MLKLLQSSQPFAWGLVPLTSAVLFVLGGLGRWEEQGQDVPWWGWLAILASARWIHVAHLGSGMRTRGNALPSWAWVLVATPLVWRTPESWWGGMLLIWLALGQGLQLKMGEVRPGVHFGLGLALGTVPIVAPELWAWVLLMPAILMAWRTPKPGEGVALGLGILAPWWFWWMARWWWSGTVLADAGDVAITHPTLDWSAGLLLPFGLVGWGLRQQSLGRATARQRVARRWTQWHGPVLGLVGIAWAGLTGGQAGWALVWTGYCVGLTWSLGWCLPPGWKGTRWVPWMAFAAALAATLPFISLKL